MKKIIAFAIVAFSMVASSFALNLSIGARGNAGLNLDVNQDAIQQVTGLTVDKDTAFDVGFGLYANAALLGGLGVQAEANFVTSNTSFNGGNNGEKVDYETMLLDVPLMVWLNLDLANFVVGFGVGPNFSTRINEMSDLKALTKDVFKIGAAAGVDAKIFLTGNLALVASVRYIMDFTKTEVPIEFNGYTIEDATYPKIDFQRKSLYGGIGLEYKIL
ncbi:MAG: porin family protein [Treponema sp.]|nr:porin family protein [Treponema sp.]